MALSWNSRKAISLRFPSEPSLGCNIMQPIWNGDRRDRVKWGAIYHLVVQYSIHDIVWVLFHRDETERHLETNAGTIPIPEPAWAHFSDVDRIRDLFGEERTVRIFENPFDQRRRREYASDLLIFLRTVPRPRLVFLDPDTGIASGRAGIQHVTEQEIAELWNTLDSGDMLVVYQHAARRKNWQANARHLFKRACGGARVEAITGRNIAADIAILCALPKSRAASSTSGP